MKFLPSLIICCLLFLFIRTGFSQKSDSISKNYPRLQWEGFVRADAVFDTRQVVEAREGYLLLYPKNRLNDKSGEDINAHGSFNQYAMTARLKSRLTGPKVLGAATTALIEGDFTGASNSENNSFRLRHAYFKMKWEHVSLLAGQFWHPLDVPEMLPDMAALNTGAPFHSYSRQPQLRVEYSISKSNLVFAISSQRDYVSAGPQGSSSVYLRNSMITNIHMQYQWRSGNLLAGAGFDFKQLTPRMVTDSGYKASEKINSYAGLAFMKLSLSKVVIKAQAILGQNLNDHLMMGGYAVSAINPLNDHRTYTNLSYLSGWLGLSSTGKKVQGSVFAGYTKSLGATEKIAGPVYARDPDIGYLFRVSPMLTWLAGNMAFNFETEWTVAAYGKSDEYYRISQTESFSNVRFSLVATYNF
ncbi:MAG: hypothetical protein IPH88_00855 [Bacteroidales bacterium]|nr:hypothetical protein [Bacteroidales bacterium]